MNLGSTEELRIVDSEDGLREVVEEPVRAMAEKAISCVDEQSRRFIAASPLFLLATSGADGELDVSPRGDAPGSVLVADDGRSLAFPDRQGNRRLDAMRNMLRNPQVGMLFVVPGVGETLRVNGRATIVRDAPFFAAWGGPPQLAIVVQVEELFLHCGRAFQRSSLWQPPSWPDRADLPSTGELVKSQRAAGEAGWSASARSAVS